MRIPNKLQREEGAAAVEFALIVGVLVILLFGMLQFGLAFFELQNLRAATREGARVGAVGGDESAIRASVASASLGSIGAGNGAIAVVECPPEATETDQSTVDIDLASAALPVRLQDIFTVDIPLIPPIPITAVVHGEFRCER